MRDRDTQRDDTTVEASSGNVFADLGRPDAEEMLMKARMVREIDRIVTARGLTQVEAAAVLGIEQPDVSNLLRGRLRGFSTDRLMKFLLLLNQDIEITIRPAVRDDSTAPCGRVSVVAY